MILLMTMNFLNHGNIILMLMSTELMLLSVNLDFALFLVYLNDMIGQLFVLLVSTVAYTRGEMMNVRRRS